MFSGLIAQQAEPQKEQLLKLYWNRAGVKRELRSLKTERYELLDKLKEQEGAIVRAQEQLEGLERLLANPVAAANAMVYFQLRHMWRVAALRLEQFGSELHAQREKRERSQLHDAAIAKRNRRLSAINEKLKDVMQKRKRMIEEAMRLAQRLERMNVVIRFFRGPRIRHRIQRAQKGRQIFEQKIEEINELIEKIDGEPLPELEGLTLESRRLINAAVIAFAQHLVIHFSEYGLASLAKAATQRPVADMKFGDRQDCDRMVERIRERIEELRQDKKLADRVKQRADSLIKELNYGHETDSVPMVDCVASISQGDESARHDSGSPVRINVLHDDYWDMYTILR